MKKTREDDLQNEAAAAAAAAAEAVYEAAAEEKTHSSSFLTCGCCGRYFETWVGYVDQDQDEGYGICKSCQGWIEDRAEADWVALEELVREGLEERNREKWDKMDADTRRGFASVMVNRGVIRFEFTRD